MMKAPDERLLPAISATVPVTIATTESTFTVPFSASSTRESAFTVSTETITTSRSFRTRVRFSYSESTAPDFFSIKCFDRRSTKVIRCHLNESEAF